MNKPLLLISLVSLLLACSPSKPKVEKDEFTGEDIPTSEVIDLHNPPAEGFNQEGSDFTAMLIADKAMSAMGGRANWDATNAISWNFFGYRKHIWDKAGNRVRIDYLKEPLSVALDMNTMTGKVWKNKKELTETDSLKKYLNAAKSDWINDSYWVVMPFKLKDSGVTLEYYGEDTTKTGIRCDVLRLTFEEVGDTPDNAYHVWVDVDTRLVRQWAWYVNALDTEPRFVLPWDNYKNYGSILLADERGDRNITEIEVLAKAPEHLFSKP